MNRDRSIQSLSTIDLAHKTVLLRVDFNVPLSDSGEIEDDGRIRAAIPTIRYLTNAGAKVVLASHLGRPKGKPVERYSLAPITARLSQLLNQPVDQLNDCVGPEIRDRIAAMHPGDVVMLENVRFHPEESKNDPQFAKQLVNGIDLYVNDCFGASHRDHASISGVTALVPSYYGFLLEKEVDYLEKVIKNPERPFVAIIGGSKISSKINVLTHLLDKVDTLVIGGAMAFTFLKAQGISVGASLVEEDRLPAANAFLEKAAGSRTRVLLPVDQVVADACDNNAHWDIVDIHHIPNGMMGLDAGPKTVKEIEAAIADAKTVLWNGPLGVFELPNFSKGTFEVARILAHSNAITVVGGGDSAAAVRKAGVADQMTHISTGGGASLEFLEGIQLPGLKALECVC